MLFPFSSVFCIFQIIIIIKGNHKECKLKRREREEKKKKVNLF